MLDSQVVQLQELRAAAETVEDKLKDITAMMSNGKGSPLGLLRNGGLIPNEMFSVFEALVEARRATRSVLSAKLKKGSIVRRKSLSNWRAQIDAIAATSEEIVALTATVQAEARPLTLTNNSTLVLQADSQVIADFAQPARNLMTAVDSIAADPLASAVAVVSPDDRLDTEVSVADAAAASEALMAIRETYATAKATQDTIQTVLDEVTAAQERMISSLSDLERRLATKVEEAEAATTSIQSNDATVSGNAAVVSSKLEDVSKWASQAQDAFSEISKFSSALDSIQKRLKDAESRAGGVVKDMEDQRGAVEKLLKSADQMLKGSTVAGLATAFDKERTLLDQRMKDSLWFFALGILLIIAGTSLLALYLFQIKTDIALPGFQGDAAVTLSGFLARAVILLGPIWLTLFSTRRYRRLFDLRQQYSHKYAMAFSVDGFQRQAPSFREQIAYWVFQTVGQPPQLGKEGRPMDDHPANTLRELLDMIADRLPIPKKAEGSSA